MEPTYYDRELERLADTYRDALQADVSRLRVAIASASESSIIAVGSGGSFTTASLLCSLHETYTARISRPSTPLEIICTPTLAATSPVFLVSAEGKNPDIVEALQRARMHSARPVHILTNRRESPLLECAHRLSDVTTHVFELAEKDGYLATNSLLLDAVLVARVYGELDKEPEHLPPTLGELSLESGAISSWHANAIPLIREIASRRSLLIVYSPLLRPVAADLESKLAESALLHCQLADLRSFAHGRHLWLASRPSDCGVLALVEPSLGSLWESMRALLPHTIPTLTMSFLAAKPRDLIAGLVAQMSMVSAIAHENQVDPARPEVAQFGRQLHYMELRRFIPEPRATPDAAERSKHEVLGARWPSLERRGAMRRALSAFKTALAERAFRVIVFDYDGTLCSSHRHDAPPSPAVVARIRTLVEAGVTVGIASGRGTSIQEHLQRALPASIWPKIYLGLYNSGFVSTLAESPPAKGDTSEYLSHVTRIVRRLKALGAPIERIRPTHPYQVSVRFQEGVHPDANWFVIADALRQAGLDLSRVVISKHSVDILETDVNKSHLVAYIIRHLGIDPYDVLTVGDQGAWPGNDSSLLEHRYSLSVDVPSRRLDRGWKLAPAHKRDVDATLWYLDRIRVAGPGSFVVELRFDMPSERS